MELAPVVIQAVETARLLSNDHTIEVDDAGSTLRVNADEPRMEQVVLNLLTNAVNHAPDSNRIDVRLRAIDGQAEIAVQDDGPGIPATVLPHLFSRFFRGGAEGKGPGLGLGLYISREIVAAHGGTIGVESTEGQGATFTVRLPLLDGATEQPAR
jgi:signal transduction histidine kinase